MSNQQLLEILIKATDNASGPLSDIAKALNNTSGQSNAFASIAKDVGVAILGLGTAALGTASSIAGLSIKMASDFQNTLMKTSTNLDLNKTQTAELSNAIQGIMEISPSPMDDIAEAYRTAGSEGFTLAQSTDLITQTNQAAMVTGDKVSSITNALSVAMHDYGASSKQSAEYLGDMHGAMVAGNMTMQQLSPNIGILANTTSLASVSFQQAVSAMSLMTAHGASASEATTSINQALMSMIKPTVGAQAALKQLSATTGVDLTRDFSAAGLKSKGLEGVLQDLNKATDGNIDSLAKVLPNVRGLRFLMADAATGGKEFAHDMQTVADGQNALADSYEANQDNLTNLTGILQNQMNVALIQLGTTLLPYVIKAIKFLTDAWSSHRDQINQVIQWIAKEIPVAFDKIQQAIGWLKDNILPLLLKGWDKLKEAFQYFKDNVIPPLLKMWDNLVQNFNWFVQNVWPIIVNAFKSIGDNIMTNLWPALQKLWEGWYKLWTVIEPLLMPILAAIAIVIGVTLYVAIQGIIVLLTFFSTCLGNLYDWCAQIITVTVNMANAWNNGWNSINDAINNAIFSIAKINLADIGKNIMQGLINGIAGMAPGISKTVSNIASSIGDGFKKALGIHSPSTVTMEIGDFTAEGLAQGLTKNTSIQKATNQVTSSIVQPLSNIPNSTSPSSPNNVSNTQSVVININLPNQPIFLNDQSLVELAKRAKRAFISQGFQAN